MFIQVEMIMSFSFIKSALILTKRQNKQHIRDMTNIFRLGILLFQNIYEEDQLKVTLMGIGLSKSFWFKIAQYTHTLLILSDRGT